MILSRELGRITAILNSNTVSGLSEKVLKVRAGLYPKNLIISLPLHLLAKLPVRSGDLLADIGIFSLVQLYIR